jgi:hypothetical protein
MHRVRACACCISYRYVYTGCTVQVPVGANDSKRSSASRFFLDYGRPVHSREIANVQVAGLRAALRGILAALLPRQSRHSCTYCRCMTIGWMEHPVARSCSPQPAHEYTPRKAGPSHATGLSSVPCTQRTLAIELWAVRWCPPCSAKYPLNSAFLKGEMLHPSTARRTSQ